MQFSSAGRRRYAVLLVGGDADATNGVTARFIGKMPTLTNGVTDRTVRATRVIQQEVRGEWGWCGDYVAAASGLWETL